MILDSLDSKVRMVVSLAILLGVSLAPGCAAWDHATEIEGVEAGTDWESPLRSSSPTGQQTGIDRRAREIERSLGVK